jgi:hypothetical protein
MRRITSGLIQLSNSSWLKSPLFVLFLHLRSRLCARFCSRLCALLPSLHWALLFSFLGAPEALARGAQERIQDRETLVILEALDGIVYSDALICLESRGDLYLPVTEAAQALGVAVHEPKPGFLKIEVGESFVESEFPVCSAVDLAECPSRFSRRDRFYMTLSDAKNFLKWSLSYDSRRLALVIDSVRSDVRTRTGAVEPSSKLESLLVRDFIAKPQFSLQANHVSREREFSLSGAVQSPLLGHDFWGQVQVDQIGPSRQSTFDGFLTLGRRSSQADLLGPFRAQQYDLFGIRSPELAYISRSKAMWGLQISNFDQLGTTGLFSQRTLRGQGFPQWKAELFLNGVFLSETMIGSDYTYEFTDVPVYFGINSYTVVLTSPLGQKEIREEVFRVDSQTQRPGAFGYRMSSGTAALFALNHLEFSRGINKNYSAQAGITGIEDRRLGIKQVFFAPQLNYIGNGYSLQVAALSNEFRGSALILSPRVQFGSTYISADWVNFHRFQSPLINPTGEDLQRSETLISTLTPFFWGEERNPSSLQLKIDSREFRDGPRDDALDLRLLTRVRGLTYTIERRQNFQSNTSESIFEILKSGNFISHQVSFLKATDQDLRIAALLDHQVKSRDRFVAGFESNVSSFDEVSASFRWARDWRSFGSEIRFDLGKEVFWGVSLSSAWVKQPADSQLQSRSGADISSAGIRCLVFVDDDEDGTWDEGELRIANVRIRSLQTQQEYTSDQSGIVAITDLPSYVDQAFEVVIESIPNFYLTPAQQKVSRRLTPAQIVHLSIPLLSRFDLKGSVRLPSWHRLVPLVVRRSNGEIFAKITTNRQGQFRVGDLPAGTYRIEADEVFLRSAGIKPVSIEVQLSGVGGLRIIEPINFELQVQEGQ